MKNKELRIGIIGHGFVGKATDWGFDINVRKYVVDPKYGNEVKDLTKLSPEIIFICVPTPMGKNGEQDSSIIEEVVRDVKKYMPRAIMVVKSTVIPSVLKKISKISKNIIFNPEFLREKHANEDFVNSEMIIFGGDKDLCKKVSHAYLIHSKCLSKEHIFLDLLSASLVKFSINTFLATKVIFFNEMYEIFKNLDVQDSWENMIETISTDKRIGKSHMNVPGHDGRYGFGGACFPKDSMALIRYAKENGLEPSVLINAVKKNNKIRSAYKDLDAREKEQNVTFFSEI